MPVIAVTALLLAGALAAQQAAPQPVPQPFPRPGAAQPQRPGQPSTPATPTAPSAPAAVIPAQPAEVAPTPAALGVPMYPGAQFLASYDAGRSQRFFLFGTAASFLDVVAYYRNVLKQKGELVYDAPATHEFDVGKYHEETMAFPPGVTVKEFKSEVSEGYPNPTPGLQPTRFPTVIQVVPVVER
jgi:hypothetical protein